MPREGECWEHGVHVERAATCPACIERGLRHAAEELTLKAELALADVRRQRDEFTGEAIRQKARADRAEATIGRAIDAIPEGPTRVGEILRGAR